MNTKKMCMIGILTSLYCVLSAMMKFTVIGNIQIDLGYCVMAAACVLVGPWAGFVGAVGCALESVLFSAYGFSISWFTANLILGVGCGLVFQKTENWFIRVMSVLLFMAVGMVCVKTSIECYLYNIPLYVKIPKNATAFMIDSAAMVAGMPLCRLFRKLR